MNAVLKPVIHPFKGPHEGKEYTLMVQGVKPLAMVGAHKLSTFKLKIMTGEFVCSIQQVFYNATQYLIALYDERWRIPVFSNIYEHAIKAGKLSQDDHIKIGCLLGYEKRCVEAFINDEIDWQAWDSLIPYLKGCTR